MAVNLNTSASGAGADIKKQIEKETNLKFKLVKYSMVALAAVMVVKAATGIWGHYNAVQDLSMQIEQKQASFDKLKSEVEAWHLEHDKASTDLDQESGKVISEIKLPSARDLGIEAAALQNKLLDGGGLLHDDEQRLSELVTGRYGSAQAWFGGSLPPGSVEWEFATWYDGEANAEAYECVWQCWRNEQGVDYLVAIAVGTFNVRAENFTLNTVYVTSFGTMLVQNGAIRADASKPVDDGGVSEMVGELTDGETEGSSDNESGDPEEGSESDPDSESESESGEGDDLDTEGEGEPSPTSEPGNSSGEEQGDPAEGLDPDALPNPL